MPKVLSVLDVSAALRTSAQPAFDVTHPFFGALGDNATDDTTAINAAITAANAAGGGDVWFPTQSGVYRCNGQIILKHGVRLRAAPGAVTLDFSNSAAYAPSQSQARFKANGAVSNSTAVSVDVVEGDRTLTVASTTGYAVDDVVWLQSDEADFYGASAEGTKGEIHLVAAVTDSTHLELHEPTWAAYALSGHTVTLQKIAPLAVHLEGLRFLGKGVNAAGLPEGAGGTNDTVSADRGDVGFWFQYATRVSFKQCRWKGFENKGVYYDSSIRLTVDECEFLFDELDVKLQYGIDLNGPSQWVNVTRCKSYNDRHMLTGGGGTGGCPRFIVAEGNHCSGSWQNPLNGHAGSEYFTFKNNHISSKWGGFGARGRHFIIEGNTVHAPVYGVSALYRAGQFQIRGNVFIGATKGIDLDNANLHANNLAAATELLLAENEFRGCATGVSIADVGSDTNLWEGTRITNNVFVDGGTAISTHNLQGAIVSGNQCRHLSAAGFVFDDAATMVIAQNVFDDIAGGSIPTYVARDTAVGGTGDLTLAMPAGIAAGDLLLLVVETADEAVATPSGWTVVTSSPQAVTAATRLSAFWKRASATEPSVVITDPGDHGVSCILAFRGCATTGDPFDVVIPGTEAVSDTSLSATGGTTTRDNCLMVVVVVGDADVAAATHYSAWTNADLASITNRLDTSSTLGNGGMLAVTTGTKATAGAFGATTATSDTAAQKAFMTLALRPVGYAVTFTGIAPTRSIVRSNIFTAAAGISGGPTDGASVVEGNIGDGSTQLETFSSQAKWRAF